MIRREVRADAFLPGDIILIFDEVFLGYVSDVAGRKVLVIVMEKNGAIRMHAIALNLVDGRFTVFR